MTCLRRSARCETSLGPSDYGSCRPNHEQLRIVAYSIDISANWSALPRDRHACDCAETGSTLFPRACTMPSRGRWVMFAVAIPSTENFRVKVIKEMLGIKFQLRSATALLQNSRLRRDFPFPLQAQAKRTILAVPRALKRLMMAARIWSSAVWRSGSSKDFRQRIFAAAQRYRICTFRAFCPRHCVESSGTAAARSAKTRACAGRRCRRTSSTCGRGWLGLRHAARLTAWIRDVNPAWRKFRNNAHPPAPCW